MNGTAPISVRWVDTSNGSKAAPEYRSRLVVIETKRRSTIYLQDNGSVFASTPPLEATRNICSSVMSRSIAVGQCTKDDDVILAFFDISRAHPHVELKRRLFVELPLEHTEHAKLRVGRLRRHLHGVPDAGQNFGLKVQEVVEGAVAKIWRDNPCVFSKIVGGWGELSFLHHCDDFILAGRLTVVFETVDTIRGTFIVKV